MYDGRNNCRAQVICQIPFSVLTAPDRITKILILGSVSVLFVSFLFPFCHLPLPSQYHHRLFTGVHYVCAIRSHVFKISSAGLFRFLFRWRSAISLFFTFFVNTRFFFLHLILYPDFPSYAI